MNLIVWLIFGGLAGWIGTILTGNDARFGIFGNIIIGIVGAWLGGWIARRFFKSEGVTGFDFRSFIVAVIGSALLLAIINLLT